MQKQKKHYWTHTHIVTALLSCSFGFVTGSFHRFPCYDSSTEVRHTIRRNAHSVSENGDLICSHPISGPSTCPLVQPGAALLHPMSGVTIAHVKCNRYEGVPTPPVKHRSSHGCTLDATPILIEILLLLGTTLGIFRLELFSNSLRKSK